MSAAFNTPDRGDNAVNETKTSDAPQFDIKSLYSDISATARGGSAKSEPGDQLDFGPSDIYARISNNDRASGNLNFEQESAMEIARRFSSIDNENKNASSDFNFDREDAGRLIEVYGDMYNAQNAIQEGDKSEAKDWLGEMRRDLADFTRGLFSDSENGGHEGREHGRERGHGDHGRHESDQESEESDNQECHGHECTDDSQPDHGDEESHGESDHGSGEETEHGSESGSEHGSEEGNESNDSYIGSSSEGYTPQDSMVLLMNDMQELSQALANGDSEAVQQIMARMNRHLALLMRQLSQSGEEGEAGEEQAPGTDRPVDSSTGGGQGNERDSFNPLNPGDLLGSLPLPPSPGDLLNSLPNPGDLLGRLPQPPSPGDLLGRLPQPPSPGDLLSGLPDPGDILGRLPQPPNPQDLLSSLPKPPSPSDLLNPGNLLDKLPSPGDIFDLF